MSLKNAVVSVAITLGAILMLTGPAVAAGLEAQTNNQPFTMQIGLVFIVLLLVIGLFVLEWVRVDVVGIIMMVLLPVLGLVTPHEAISGLSSNAVVAIIAVIIIGAGLDKTGCMNVLSRRIIKAAGKSENRIMVLISATVALISSFMQNIGAAALFMPAVIRIGRQTGIPASRILMPMGYCAIIGGTITLVGASPTILLNDLIEQSNQLNALGIKVEPLGLFTQTPIGLALVVSAIFYFVIFGRFIMPRREDEKDDNRLMPSTLADTYQEVAGVYELEVPDDFGSFTLEELHVRDRYHVSIIGVYLPDKKLKNYAPARYELIQSGETLAMIGNEPHVIQCAKDLGLIFKGELDVFAEDFSANNAGLLEGIVTPRSTLAGQTMRDLQFRKINGVVPVVLCRDGICQFNQITQEKIKPGDALLMFGRWEKFRELQKKNWFTFTTEVKGEEIREERASTALAWLVITVGMILWLEPLTSLPGFSDKVVAFRLPAHRRSRHDSDEGADH